MVRSRSETPNSHAYRALFFTELQKRSYPTGRRAQRAKSDLKFQIKKNFYTT